MCCLACRLKPALPLAGQSTDLSFLDPINRADTPPKAIQLAAGELSLRVVETRRRLDAGLGPLQDTIQRTCMHGKPGGWPATFVLWALICRSAMSWRPTQTPCWCDVQVPAELRLFCIPVEHVPTHGDGVCSMDAC